MRNPFEVYTSMTGEKRRRQLDWDESAADTQTAVDEVYDGERGAPDLGWLVVALSAVFLVLAGRLFYLQVIRGQEFRLLSENNRIRSQTVLAPRGKILDRNGAVLAQNTASFNLVATPFDLPKQGLNEEIDKLAAAFGLEPAEIRQKLDAAGKRSIEPVSIKQNLSQEQSILFETRASEFVGFSVEEIPVRDYANAPAFSHVLGYTGLVSPGDLEGRDKKLYAAEDFIGKLGIELQYENFLHGSNGQDLVEVDATGKILNVLGEYSPVPGSTLVLNIDKDLQEKLYDGIRKSLGSQRGAAVALNPKNGQVLALVSSPGFNNNLFAPGISVPDYKALLDDKNQPLFNRVLAGQYPPGSTVKPMVAAAALQENIVTPETIIVDRGSLVIPNQYDPSIAYTFRGWKPQGLGPMTVRSAIAQSSDIYFYVVSGGYPGTAVTGGLGAEKIAVYYRKFGVGSPTGIDLKGEGSGVVADPDWKAGYYKDDAIMSKWYLGDTYHVGIGQGDMLVTPLQVAEWTAVVANGGTGYKPRVASKVLDRDGRTLWESSPEVLVSNVASGAVMKVVQEGMRETVTAGTARSLQTLPISSAGKTGTSQFDGSDPSRTHAWFTSYAPYEDPQIVITVLVEAGGEGNAAALPITKEALKWWAENRYGE